MHKDDAAKEFFNQAYKANFGGDPFAEAGNADYCHDATNAIIKKSFAWHALERIAQGVENPQGAAKQAMKEQTK